MFTGIIETTGKITAVSPAGSGKSFWVESPISSKLQPDQSLCHDGVCLTVEEIAGNSHRVTAVAETLKKTTLGLWQPGSLINLERCLQLGDRLDGHMVQGHADASVICLKRKEKKGSWEFDFELPGKFAPLLIEKGSVTINGISLTAFNVKKKSFRVAIIPYTFEHTNISRVMKDTPVNIEFDVIGKYLLRTFQTKKNNF
ncbi:MAG: riboflavin synthase [Bacteroidetes bacterium]|nr:riboflavin synthase [Bacteroidota bacterium]